MAPSSILALLRTGTANDAINLKTPREVARPSALSCYEGITSPTKGSRCALPMIARHPVPVRPYPRNCNGAASEFVVVVRGIDHQGSTAADGHFSKEGAVMTCKQLTDLS